jgi:hypothetical protein
MTDPRKAVLAFMAELHRLGRGPTVTYFSDREQTPYLFVWHEIGGTTQVSVGSCSKCGKPIWLVSRPSDTTPGYKAWKHYPIADYKKMLADLGWLEETTVSMTLEEAVGYLRKTVTNGEFCLGTIEAIEAAKVSEEGVAREAVRLYADVGVSIGAAAYKGHQCVDVPVTGVAPAVVNAVFEKLKADGYNVRLWYVRQVLNARW